MSDEESGRVAKRLKSSASSSPTNCYLLSLSERPGDIFTHPRPALLIHACNCLGHWGKGIAAAFKQKYPQRYEVYAEHCRKSKEHPEGLLGTALLIGPQPTGLANSSRKSRTAEEFIDESHGDKMDLDWIGCLFTRVKPGMPRSKSLAVKRQAQVETLEATAKAMRDLVRLVKEAEGSGRMVGTISWAMPRINAGLFGVDWDATKAVLSKLTEEEMADQSETGAEIGSRKEVPNEREVTVYVPASAHQ